MNKILILITTFISGFLILVFMPLPEDSNIYDNYIYINSAKGLDNKRKIVTVSEDNNNSINSEIEQDLVCNFSSNINSDIKAYNELMVQYATRYAAAANKLYNPPLTLPMPKVRGFLSDERTVHF